MDGLGETMMGRAIKLSLSVIGVRRSLQKVTRAFRSNNNYTEVESRELSPTSVILEFNHLHGTPTFYQGVMEAALEHINAKNGKVKYIPVAGPGGHFHVTWD